MSTSTGQDHRISLFCPAKVNLALSVGAPLSVPDKNAGLHPIASWMVAVDFGDTLTLELSTSSVSHFDILFEEDGPVPAKVDWPLEKDLAFRAVGVLEAQVGRTLPVRLTLRKRIPAGAGLGGGSSDAAAALVGMNDLFQLGLDMPTLMNLSSQLGSDIAFLIAAQEGRTSAIVTGLGEQLESAPIAKPLHIVLIFPPFGCPTGPVYRAFDQLHPDLVASGKAADGSRVWTLKRQTKLPPNGPFNDLYEPACVVRPQLTMIVAQLNSLLSAPIHMSGSGSTLFILAPDAGAAKAMAQRTTNVLGLAAVAVKTR